MCDLLGRALATTIPPNTDSDSDIGAGGCRSGDTGLHFDVRQAPLVDPSKRGEPIVPLSFGSAVSVDLSGRCRLSWAQTPVPNPLPLRDTLVGTVSGDRCEDLGPVAEQVHAALAGPPPPPPPAPAQIGFRIDQPDEPIVAACTHNVAVEYEPCREPAPIDVPDSIDEIMKLTAPAIGDVACALLGPAMSEFYGADHALMVIHDNRCTAVTADHSVEVTFSFYAHDPANAYCTGSATETLTIAGQPAISCHINSGEDGTSTQRSAATPMRSATSSSAWRSARRAASRPSATAIRPPPPGYRNSRPGSCASTLDHRRVPALLPVRWLADRFREAERERKLRYVGMSRARDLLVVRGSR